MGLQSHAPNPLERWRYASVVCPIITGSCWPNPSPRHRELTHCERSCTVTVWPASVSWPSDFVGVSSRPVFRVRSRRGVMRLTTYVGALVLAILSAEVVHGQTFPARNVTMFVPFAAGGPTDV